MLANRLASALLAATALSLGGPGSSASAADMMPLKVKAPPPPASVPLDIHYFADVTFLNDYITPRGLLVTNTGLTTQILTGIALDLYKDKAGFINDISVNGGAWSDLWSEQHDVHVNSWNEFDWWVGMTVTFAQNWTAGVQYIEFIPPAADLATSFPAIEHNMEFSLSYDDTSWGWPIPIHPYVKLFYELRGPSTVVLGKSGDTYDVEIGIVPTYDAKKATGMPLVLTAATWVTVGPSSYWNKNDGTTNACGDLVGIAVRAEQYRRLHHRAAGQVGARRGAEAAGQLVREGRRPLLPHLQRRLAGRAGVHRFGRRRVRRDRNLSERPS